MRILTLHNYPSLIRGNRSWHIIVVIIMPGVTLTEYAEEFKHPSAMQSHLGWPIPDTG